jgi:type IV pilus assembly protein PilY1
MGAGKIRGSIKRGTLGAMMAGVVWCGNAAANDIASVPLFLTQSVEPNILFILDDSGSMHLEIGSLIEEGNLSNADSERRVFPRREGPGTDNSLHNATPTFEDHNRWNYRLRNAELNPLFYDPDVEYRPWVDSQGNERQAADPANVPIDPERPNDYVRDLTTQLSETTNWHDGDQNVFQEERSYWPITYFIYNGGDIDVRDNYTRIEIRGNDLYINGEGPKDASALPSGRSIEAEIQNFANWYTYYRNRKNTARAGIGRAFLGLPDDIRVGFGRINSNNQTVDGQGGTRAVIRGVRAFDATARAAFYEDLYGTSFGGGTPLRLALAGAGDYYERQDDQGPWSSTPGIAGGDADTQLECRRSYTMLMTDGEWKGDSPNVGNVDGQTGPEISDGERFFQYTPEPPFEDDNSDMLADVAMKYWNRDLRPNLPNKVPTSENNPAFWQHMVTFTIGFGVGGELDPETDLEALASGELDWTDHRIDDLWHAAINGRGEYLNATRPDEFTEGVTDVLDAIILRERGSSSSIATNSTRLANDSEIYQARFNSANWTGELIAFGLNSDGSVGDARWNAAETLKNKAPDSRNIITSQPDGTAVAFAWDQLTTDQQAQLGSAAVLDWLRGHRSEGDGFRNIGVLGDIVNSDPAFSGNADFGFRQLGDDTQAPAYAAYLSNRDVHPTVYVGANDGMLHAFNADTGEERFAYVPASIYDHLAELPQEGYVHRYYVDGSPKVFDAYIDSQWRTVLIGTTGAGGRGVFALDVTDPTTVSTSDVLFDIDDGDLPDLGATIPKATVARLNDGNFWAIFGNGYNSANGKAVLYLRNLDDGTTITIDTEADGGNGLSSPIPVDVDGDRVTDRIYAGDLKGNLWRFDVDGNQGQWGFSNDFRQGNTPKPLFTARDSNDNVQPITPRPEVGRHPDGGLMVYFGTGTFFRTGDNVVSGSDPRQSFYGIRDQDAPVAGRSALLMQEITFEGTATFGGEGDAGTGTNQAKVRVVSEYEDASKTGGFYLDLISPANGFEGERVVADAQLRFGRIVFTTLIPSTDPCSFGGSSWIMELDAFDGGSYGESIFDLNEDDNFDESDYVEVSEGVFKPVSGLASEVGIVNKPSIITAGEVEYKYTSGSSGEVGVVKEITGSDLLGRQSWRQLR